MAKKDGLRPNLTVDQAADVICTLVSSEVYLRQTVERGCSPSQWQDWMATTGRA